MPCLIVIYYTMLLVVMVYMHANLSTFALIYISLENLIISYNIGRYPVRLMKNGILAFDFFKIGQILA